MNESLFSFSSTRKDTLLQSILSLPFAIRLIGFLSAVFLTIATFFLGVHLIDKYFFVSVPKAGGVLTEGVTGRPRFINPIIAKTEVDRDLVALLYSGLFRPEGTELAFDLAETLTISEDGKTYTVTIKDNATFHDNTKVTSADIVFTVERIQHKGLPSKSPLAPSFVGVHATAPDIKTVVFELEKPYTAFKDALTFGVLPKHIWEPVSVGEFDQTNYNLEPVGSGPYVLDEIIRDTKRGLAKEYHLSAFDGYVHGKPLIKEFHIKFYGSEADRVIAYKTGEIMNMPSAPTVFAREQEEAGTIVLTSAMPRTFGIYFNQTRKSVLALAPVRKALSLTLPRQAIISTIFGDYATQEIGPFSGLDIIPATADDAGRLEAEALLEKEGWKKNASGLYEKLDPKTKTTQLIQFSLSIPDIPDMLESAKMIVETWNAFGFAVEIHSYELSTFTADILASRNFDAAYFGQVTGRDPDPYSFWHSSQKTHGANIAQYSSKTVDAKITALSRTLDSIERRELLREINHAIITDSPAIFAYSPQFVYLTDIRLRGVSLPLLTTASERFANIEQWYLSSERIWKFLSKHSQSAPVEIQTTVEE